MPLFEIFIPAVDADGFDITARIRADSWIQALRNGLAKLGDTTDVRNVLCDITESSIDVTEPKSGRVFRIRDLGEAAAAPLVTPTAPAAVSAPQPVSPPAPAPRASAAVLHGPPPPAPLAVAPTTSATPAAVAPGPSAAAAGAAGPKAPVRRRFSSDIVDEHVRQERRAAGGRPADIGRPSHALAAPSVDDVIAELFESTRDIYTEPDIAAAARFVLKLAVRTVPAESGSVFIADINRNDLYFVAAFGPKAQEVMGFRVAMGQGIVGFAAQEGVSLAVSDVERDPRFYAAISKKIGYQTRSILCSPAQRDGRVFGAIELINKRGSSSFAPHEVDLLNYLAHALADYLVTTGQTGR